MENHCSRRGGPERGIAECDLLNQRDDGNEIYGEAFDRRLIQGIGDPSRIIGTLVKQIVSSPGVFVCLMLIIGASQRVYATKQEFKQLRSPEAVFAKGARSLASFSISTSWKARKGIDREENIVRDRNS